MKYSGSFQVFEDNAKQNGYDKNDVNDIMHSEVDETDEIAGEIGISLTSLKKG